MTHICTHRCNMFFDNHFFWQPLFGTILHPRLNTISMCIMQCHVHFSVLCTWHFNMWFMCFKCVFVTSILHHVATDLLWPYNVRRFQPVLISMCTLLISCALLGPLPSAQYHFLVHGTLVKGWRLPRMVEGGHWHWHWHAPGARYHYYTFVQYLYTTKCAIPYMVLTLSGHGRGWVVVEVDIDKWSRVGGGWWLTLTWTLGGHWLVAGGWSWVVVEIDIDMDLDLGGHTPVAGAPAQGVG